MSRSVYFTGGGSGGHVIPAKTIIEDLKQDSAYKIYFIGGERGVEAGIMPALVDKYYGISTGKLRRYFSWENFKDFLLVIRGFFQAVEILINAPKDSLVFSFGGFVSVPAVLAARLLRLEVYIHEQTTRAGLANRIASKVASKVFLSFESSASFYPAQKVTFSGYPIRQRFYDGPWREEVELEGERVNLTDRPTLLVTGGGNGAECLNKIVAKDLDQLLQKFQIIHQVGATHLEKYRSLKRPGYYPLAFIGDEMIDLMRFSKVVIARSGAGSVSELMALNKRAIYIPLAIAQKNEQYFNALEASRKNGSFVIEEKDIEQTDFKVIFEELLHLPDALPQRGGNARTFLLNIIKRRNWFQ